MSDITKAEMELAPRLQRMLKAYSITPPRDPESARLGREKFMADLNLIFVEESISRPSPGWYWTSNLQLLKQRVAASFARPLALRVFAVLIVFIAILFGGAGITVYAAGSSLPGDALYPLKTTLENVSAGLISDSATRARLYMEFAGRRVSEIQTLIGLGRYADITRAGVEFEGDLQQALSATEDLSQMDPAGAVVLSEELFPVLQGYTDTLSHLLEGAPEDTQPVIRNALDAVQSAASRLNGDTDKNYNDGNTGGKSDSTVNDDVGNMENHSGRDGGSGRDTGGGSDDDGSDPGAGGNSDDTDDDDDSGGGDNGDDDDGGGDDDSGDDDDGDD